MHNTDYFKGSGYSMKSGSGYGAMAGSLYESDSMRLYSVKRSTHCCGSWSRGMRCKGCIHENKE